MPKLDPKAETSTDVLNKAVDFVIFGESTLPMTKIGMLRFPEGSTEADRCREITSILRAYDGRKPQRPLSVAVFGPPGSGKSFCVGQIALALDWPDMPALAKTDDAWMVGDRLLVAPLFAGEASRQLTLPPGHWHDFWTGKAVAGGTKMEIAGSTRNIPVFVKTGTVLPLASITNSVTDAKRRELHVRIYGDGSLPFALKTPAGDLQISWEDRSGSGSINQAGNERYSVSSWVRADRDAANLGRAHA